MSRTRTVSAEELGASDVNVGECVNEILRLEAACYNQTADLKAEIAGIKRKLKAAGISSVVLRSALALAKTRPEERNQTLSRASQLLEKAGRDPVEIVPVDDAPPDR